MQHIIRSIKPTQTDFNKTAAEQKCFEFIIFLAANNCTWDEHTTKKCNFLNFLTEEANHDIASDTVIYIKEREMTQRRKSKNE